jgi:hypothetical protein
MCELRPTPPQPVFYGQIHFGIFRDPFPTLNLVDADIYGHRWAPRGWRNLRLKEWQHFGLIHDDVYCGLAVFDAKFMGVSFCSVYDRTHHTVVEHKHTTLKRSTIHVPEHLLNGDGFFRQPGYHVQVHNRLNQGFHQIQITIRSTRTGPSIQGEFTSHENLDHIQPLIAVLPVNNYRRPMYTHKAACPASGWLQVGDRDWTFDADRHWALVDVQKTFYPHEAFWQWATFAGYDEMGTPVAINLTRNMIRDDEKWNECCAWVNGRLCLLGAARFEYDPQALHRPWHITTTDNRTELTFTPQGEQAGRINLAGLVRSEFHQLFGTYTGFCVDDEGQRHTIQNVFGVTEHHILKA